MRLLHVVPSLNPLGGGPIEGLKQIVSATISLGHLVEVVTLDSPADPWLSKLPFVVHVLGPAKSSYYYTPTLVPWLRLHADEYDAVIVEGLWQFQSFGTWMALRRSRVPYFVFSHGMLSPWFKKKYPLKHLKKWLYWPWAEYRVLRDAKSVLFTAEEERILARKSFWLYRCNERVIGYGTAAPAGDPEKQRAVFLSAFPALSGKRIFLYLSRIHPVKGCDLLLGAFAEFALRDSALHLVMAGPDQTGWKRDLVSLSRNLGIEDRITWTGMISGDLKWGAYHSAEVFVLPSHQENFGVVVAEALACGVPTLISNKVNIWREIVDDDAGMAADDTQDGVSEMFSKWVSLDETARAAMRGRAAKCFDHRFEIHEVARNLTKAIQAECRGVIL